MLTGSESSIAIRIELLFNRLKRRIIAVLLFLMSPLTVLVIPVHILLCSGSIDVVSLVRIKLPVIMLGAVGATFSGATVMAGYTLSTHGFHLLSKDGLFG